MIFFYFDFIDSIHKVFLFRKYCLGFEKKTQKLIINQNTIHIKYNQIKEENNKTKKKEKNDNIK